MESHERASEVFDFLVTVALPRAKKCEEKNIPPLCEAYGILMNIRWQELSVQLPGCNRKTGAFLYLFCDYFAIKFSVSPKNNYSSSSFWSTLSVASLVTSLNGCNRNLPV